MEQRGVEEGKIFENVKGDLVWDSFSRNEKNMDMQRGMPNGE